MKVEWVPLGEVLEMSRVPLKLTEDQTYRRIGIYSWGKGMLRRDPAATAEMGSMKYFSFPITSLIFSNIQAWEGAVALTGPEDAGYVCSSRFYPYVPRAYVGINLTYMLEFFRSDQGVALMRQASPGTQVRNKVLSRAALEAAKVPVPTRQDQDRIAGHLSTLDRKEQVGLPHLGVALGNIIARVSGSSPGRPIADLMRSFRPWTEIDEAASYRPIGVRGFGRGMIRYPEMPAEALSKLRYYPVEPGALIVSNIKAWEGAVCRAEESDNGRIASNRFLQYLPTSDTIISGWIEQYLLSADGIASLGAASPGSADRNRTLSMSAFEAIEVPVPELRVQEAVVDIASTLRRVQAKQTHRDRVAAAVLPAARNEIFSAMR